jgi:hypothetical protein
VQPCPLEIAHPNGSGVSGGSTGVVIHVNVHELMVDSREPVPRLKISHPREGGELLADVHLHGKTLNSGSG